VPDSRDDLPPAIILNMHETGLGAARSLGRRGVRVIGISTGMAGPGRTTRYAEAQSAPDPGDDPDGMCDVLLSLARRLQRRCLVFPTNDADLIFLDRMAPRLAAHLTLAVPESAKLHTLIDKDRLAAFAEEQGIDTPRTCRVTSRAELEQAVSSLLFPLAMKPMRASDWRRDDVRAIVRSPKGLKLTSPAQVLEIYDRIAPLVPEVLVQEWVEGADHDFYVLGAAMGRHGKLLGAFTARKRLQYPAGFGLGCVVEAVEDKTVRERGIALLAAMDYRGVAEVEFKRDRRTGEPRLIEVNPRLWDQHALGRALGVDLAWLSYRDFAALPQGAPLDPVRRRAVWIRGSGITGALKEAAQARDATILASVGRTLRGRRQYAFWSATDPAPYLAALAARLRRIFERMHPFVPASAAGEELSHIPSLDEMRAGRVDPDFYASREWHAMLLRSVFGNNTAPVAVSASEDGEVPGSSLLALSRKGRLFGLRFNSLLSCTSPYTVGYAPAYSRQATATVDLSRQLMEQLAMQGKPDMIWLDCLSVEEDILTGMKAGLSARGYYVESYDHFRNWYEDIPGDFEDYWARRPRQLRNTVRRRLKKLERDFRVEFELLSNPVDAERAIDAYETVDAASWKGPEPYPRFIPTLIREGMGAAVTFVSILRADGEPIAAQIWVVDGTKATNFKLSHLESRKSYSPGSILTWWTMRHFRQELAIEEFDFGRGDDRFKSSWMQHSRQRRLLIACRKASVSGSLMWLRHVWVPRVFRGTRVGHTGPAR